MSETFPSRPETLDEILPGPNPSPPTNPRSALGIWEETQKVMAGMPKGDLFTRVAYLNGQTGLDQANIDRLVRQETRNHFATRTDVPGSRPGWLDQTGDAIGPLAHNVAYLAGNPNYAGQYQGTLMHNLATGWRPVQAPLPAGPPPQTFNQWLGAVADPYAAQRHNFGDGLVSGLNDVTTQFGNGAMHGLHTAGADALDGVAAISQYVGLPSPATSLHALSQGQRDAAASYPAPGPDAGLLQRAAWGVGDIAGQWGPGLAAGGAAGLAARGLGMGLAARGAWGLAGGAAYAGTGATGRAFDDLLAQGVPAPEAADRAVKTGVPVALANLISPRILAGAMGNSLAARGATFVYNEGKAGLAETGAETAWRSVYGVDRP